MNDTIDPKLLQKVTSVVRSNLQRLPIVDLAEAYTVYKIVYGDNYVITLDCRDELLRRENIVNSKAKEDWEWD